MHHNYDVADPLTSSETDVLGYLAQGLSNKDIATELSISPNTVKYHLRQIYSKLGVNRRLGAVMVAQEVGLLDSPETDNAPRYHLPHAVSSMIGRVEDLSSLRSYLDRDDVRLVTITGIGGVGKTRLAVAAARKIRNEFRDGVHYIPLAPLSSPTEIPLAIASTLAFNFPTPQDPMTQLIGYLGRKQMLLVFDNFEHLLDDVAIIQEILTHTRDITILATSRQRLGLTGEIIYALDGLDYPQDSAQHVEDFEAIVMLVNRIQASDPDFELKHDNRSDAVEIAKLVQGMPLAIELIAPRAAALSLHDIVVEIKNGLDVISSNMSDLPERHRSIYSVFEHSWQLLSPDEQDTFRRLGLFSGGFNLTSAREITGITLNTLARLNSMSLIQYDRYSRRYDMHELLRSFALEKLHQNEAIAKEACDHHAQYFANVAQEFGMKLYKGLNPIQTLSLIDADYSNIASAWEHSISQQHIDRLEQFSDMWLYFEMRSFLRKGCEQFDKTVKALESSGKISIGLGKALNALGVFLYRAGEYVKSTSVNDRAIDIFTRLDAANLSFLAHITNANVLLAKGDVESAQPVYKRALTLAQRDVNLWNLNTALLLQGTLHRVIGDLETARDYLLQMPSNGFLGGFREYELGIVHFQLGRSDDAYTYLQQSLSFAEPIQYKMLVAAIYALLAQIDQQRGRLEQAHQAYTQVIETSKDIGFLETLPDTYSKLADVAIAREDLADAKRYLYEGVLCAFEFQQGAEGAICQAIAAMTETPEPLPVFWSIITLERILQTDEELFIRTITSDLDKTVSEKASNLRDELLNQINREELTAFRAEQANLDLIQLTEKLFASGI